MWAHQLGAPMFVVIGILIGLAAGAALAFIASPALAQDKQGGSTGPAAQSDTNRREGMWPISRRGRSAK